MRIKLTYNRRHCFRIGPASYPLPRNCEAPHRIAGVILLYVANPVPGVERRRPFRMWRMGRARNDIHCFHIILPKHTNRKVATVVVEKQNDDPRTAESRIFRLRHPARQAADLKSI